MLRRIGRTLSGRKSAEDRVQSPDYACEDARRIERDHDIAVRRAERLRALIYDGPVDDSRLHGSLEALNLEPINTVGMPSLELGDYPTRGLPPVPMMPVVLEDRAEPITKPPRALLKPAESSAADTRTRAAPEGLRPYLPRARSYEFDATPIAPFVVTPIPRRPLLRRNAVSYRTHRDLPLRVQAIRRAQQEMYARQLTERSTEIVAIRRRGSAPQLGRSGALSPEPRIAPHARPEPVFEPPVYQAPVHEPPTPRPPRPKRQALTRTQSSLTPIPEDRAVVPARAASSRMRRPGARYQPPEPPRDYYIEAAEADAWNQDFLNDRRLR